MSSTALHPAQTAALQVTDSLTNASTSLVAYHSTGTLLIIGSVAQALPIAKQLNAYLSCVIVAPLDSAAGLIQTAAVPLCQGRIEELTGHLGAYQVTLQRDDKQWNPAILLAGEHSTFDLILDLGQPPQLQREVNPPGYYAPNGDEDALSQILQELPNMIGEFDKPRFFNYNSDICAHGRSGQIGCTRCLTACPTEAIRSLGESIAVDPYLCQGGGSCATACPTGAITYAYPPAANLLTQLRQMLQAFFAAGGEAPRLLFHSRNLSESVTALLPQLPGNVLPCTVEEIGAVGMDVWLSALAYGANQVLLLTESDTPPAIVDELNAQISYTQPLLNAMGYPERALQCVKWQADFASNQAVLATESPRFSIPTANYAGLTEKRTVLRLALEHLHQHAPNAPEVAAEVVLPAGAPFGTVQVNQTTCTLCMACVSVCPTSALADGGDEPKLKFNESCCVQCHLCEVSCPESAITLMPRYLFDPQQRNRLRVLNEAQPFHCISCGKPFATQQMIQNMQVKLKDHWMFQGEALQRLQMCETCRVKDMFQQ